MRRAPIIAAAGLMVAIAAAPAAAQELDAIFARANEAHARGDHAEAVASYLLLVEAGIDDADVSYDLALSYARLERWGSAIQWYERALRVRPGDEEAERGLAAARDALGRRQAETRGEALVEARPPFLDSLVRPFTEHTLALALLVLDALFFGLLIALRFVRGETARLSLGIGAPIAGLLAAAVAGGLVIVSGALDDGAPAIVVAAEASLREGPDPRATTRGDALEGERARVLDRHGQWAKVRLSGGRGGWVDADALGEIEPRATWD